MEGTWTLPSTYDTVTRRLSLMRMCETRTACSHLLHACSHATRATIPLRPLLPSPHLLLPVPPFPTPHLSCPSVYPAVSRDGCWLTPSRGSRYSALNACPSSDASVLHPCQLHFPWGETRPRVLRDGKRGRKGHKNVIPSLIFLPVVSLLLSAVTDPPLWNKGGIQQSTDVHLTDVPLKWSLTHIL